MPLSPGGGAVVAAGVAVTLYAAVRLVVLGGEATEASANAESPPTARVDRIVAGVLLAVLGLLLIAVGLLWG